MGVSNQSKILIDRCILTNPLAESATMSEKPKDPYAEIEHRIALQFWADTARAREKRDKALQNLKQLKAEYGGALRTAKGSVAVVPKSSAPVTPTTATNGKVGLKVAMIEAIDALQVNLTRKMVLNWAYEKYPHLRNSKDGTIASTFSRLKADHLETVDEERHIFRRREASVNGK